MEKVILETIKKYNLFETYSTVVVAVSGGADSMALLHILANEMSAYHLHLVVAHVNHKKREAADLDESLVREVAKEYNVPCECYVLPQNEEYENFHSYARSKRYSFFKSVAERYGAKCIVTAHHADDHLETFVHRFLYQNTPNSLVGIEAAMMQGQFKIVRPLIEVTKEKIYKYCLEKGVKFREDESNESEYYTRNRIRKFIVPPIVAESPTVYRHTRHISEQLSEDEAYFKDQVANLMKHVIQKDGIYEVPRSLLKDLPKSLSRRLIKQILHRFSLRDMTSHHVDNVLKLVLSSKPNLKLQLPNKVTCLIAYDNIQFSKNIPSKPSYDYELKLNSSVTLPNKSVIIVSQGKSLEKTEKYCINKVYLCYNEIDLPLRVRTRRTGDRIALINGYGTKKVKEIMIEEKIPKHLRDQWPIITDAKDQIIWIPLLKKSNYCKNNLLKDRVSIAYIWHGGNEEDA